MKHISPKVQVKLAWDARSGESYLRSSWVEMDLINYQAEINSFISRTLHSGRAVLSSARQASSNPESEFLYVAVKAFGTGGETIKSQLDLAIDNFLDDNSNAIIDIK